MRRGLAAVGNRHLCTAQACPPGHGQPGLTQTDNQHAAAQQRRVAFGQRGIEGRGASGSGLGDDFMQTFIHTFRQVVIS